MQENIFIAGLGLIGASLALAIKQEQPQATICGWDQNLASLATAKEAGVVDLASANFADGAMQADVIILAVPVAAALTYLDELGQLSLKENVIVTDVCSTKQAVMARAEKYNFTFVGGHPMAGSHKSGVLARDVDLFENAYFIFCGKNATAIAHLQELFKGTRAKYVELSSQEHDKITGMLSHLPHIIAAGLVNQADEFSQEHPRAMQLAAGGFRDITRIASSDPTMWRDVLLSNREILLAQLATWTQKMNTMRQLLLTEDAAAIYAFFENAKDTRESLPVHQKGAIPAFYDLFVDVPDQPGVIAEVTGILAKASVSLVNIKIHETREEIIGVLQLSFKNLEDVKRAQQAILAHSSYHCRVK